MARYKTNINRLKELEKIAEKLGIGQNREVKCVACKRKIKFEEAIILTNKKKVTYLCKKCYKKLEAGELDEKHIGTDDILKQLEKMEREIPKTPPFPKKVIPWDPYIPEPIRWEPPFQPVQPGTTDEKYYVSSKIDKMGEIFKIEPIISSHDDKTGGSA